VETIQEKWLTSAVGYDAEMDFDIQKLVPMCPGGTEGLNIQTEIFLSLIIKLSF
jgi:hypothetical protein|tara:strand:+ start:848 stop:1009 length:162 start_codon:yes stop_codon:yes gene_type:complete